MLLRKLTLLPFPRWTRAHELLSQQKIQKGDIAQIVRESDVMLRYGLGVQLPVALSLLPLCKQISFLSPCSARSLHSVADGNLPSFLGPSSKMRKPKVSATSRSLSSLPGCRLLCPWLTASCSETASTSLESWQGAAEGTGDGQSSPFAGQGRRAARSSPLLGEIFSLHTVASGPYPGP